MSKIVLDEKEVNELMDTFDFNKSIYLQELQKITGMIKKLEDIQKTQKEIVDKLESHKSLLNKFEYSDEDKLISNYSAHLSYLSRRIDELVSNSSIKKLEKILDKSNSVINFSILKLIITITICISAFYTLTKI